MKKVLFVATVLRGHVLVFHLPYMQWFQRQGYEVHLCCRNDTGEPVGEIPGCDRFIELPFERSPFSRGNLPVYRRLKALIDAEGYALIHCNTPVGGMLGRLCARDARKRGAKVVYTAHGFHFFTGAPLKNWLFFYPAERFLSRYTDLLVTINGEDYRRAQRFHAKRAVQVCGVGVAVERFSAPVDVAGVRAGLGFTMEDRLVICVGEHSRRKNHQTALRAMTLVARAHLLLCGVGEEEENLRRLAVELGIERRTHFLGFRDDVPALLGASDVFLFPSYQEGLPMSQMEAMAAGLPCVVSDVRGNRDLISPGDGGYLRKPDDWRGMGEDICRLLEDPALRKSMGDRNRRAVIPYSLDKAQESMAALYRSLLD